MKRKKGGTDIFEKKLDVIATKNFCTYNRNYLGLADSCFTPKEIEEMAEDTNNIFSSHPSYKHIDTKNMTARDILHAIRSSYTDCGNDVCIVKTIARTKSKYYDMLSEVFKPNGPESRYGWLSNFDILDHFEYTSKYMIPDFVFVDSISRDFKDLSYFYFNNSSDSLTSLYKKGKRVFGFIFNLDYSSGGGTHWVAAIIDARRTDPESAEKLAKAQKTKNLLFSGRSGGDKKKSSPKVTGGHTYVFKGKKLFKIKKTKGGNFPNHDGKVVMYYYDSTGAQIFKECKEYFNDACREFSQNFGFDCVVIINDMRNQNGSSECGVFSSVAVYVIAFGGDMEAIQRLGLDDDVVNKYRGFLFRNAKLYVDDLSENENIFSLKNNIGQPFLTLTSKLPQGGAELVKEK